jgi:hypothetical protein
LSDGGSKETSPASFPKNFLKMCDPLLNNFCTLNSSLTQLDYFRIFYPTLFLMPTLEVFAGKIGTNSTCLGMGTSLATIKIDETGLNITSSALVQMPLVGDVTQAFFRLTDSQNANSCLLGPLLNGKEVKFYPIIPALKIKGQDPVAGDDGKTGRGEVEIDVYMILFYALLGVVTIGLIILAIYFARRRKKRKAFLRKFRAILNRPDPPADRQEDTNPVLGLISPMTRRMSSPGPSKDPSPVQGETVSEKSRYSFHTGNEWSVKSSKELKPSGSFNCFHTASPGTVTTDSFKTAESFTYESDVDEDLPDVQFGETFEQAIEVDRASVFTVETVKGGNK